jgi:hypothetical protein
MPAACAAAGVMHVSLGRQPSATGARTTLRTVCALQLRAHTHKQPVPAGCTGWTQAHAQAHATHAHTWCTALPISSVARSSSAHKFAKPRWRARGCGGPAAAMPGGQGAAP